MKPYKVLVSTQLEPEAEAALAAFTEYEVWDPEEPQTSAAVGARLADKDGLLLDGGLKVNSEMLAQAPNLKVVSNISVGYNNFDLAAMKERGIVGTNTPGILDDTVADLTLGLMLAASRRICELDRKVRAGGWTRDAYPNFCGYDVHHRTLGIIGMGRIGLAVAQRARFGFNMEVVYHNRNRKPQAELTMGVRYLGLPELLRESDYVVLITPYTPETHHLMGAEQFALMKPTACFVNVSRGRNVDEQALIAALQNGTIASAGLDVFEHEPIKPDNPLLQMDNVVLLPHIGGNTARTRLNMMLAAIRNLKAALKGETVKDIVPELK